MKQKKDIVFIVVLGIALVNLILVFARAVSGLVAAVTIDKGWTWWDFTQGGLWLFIDGIAIIGILYLLRSYRRARKETKRLERKKEREEFFN
jgi:hypothetical protein